MDFDLRLYSPHSTIIEDHLLALPITHDYVPDQYPPGLEAALDLEALGNAAKQGRPGIISTLQTAVKRWPTVPVLKNFLEIAYRVAGKNKQATAVLEESYKQHPDYLFARLGKVRQFLEESNIAEARALLGEHLDVMALLPGRSEAHISEVRIYYSAAARLYALEGTVDKALGIRSALAKLLPATDPVFDYVDRSIMEANLRSLQNRIQADEKRRIIVNEALIVSPDGYPTIPSFYHPEIMELYTHDFTIPRQLIDTILSLPRQTLVADLCRALDHFVAAAPYLYHHEALEDQHTITLLHVLHFLAACEASDALPAVLHFLELHTDLLEMYLGDPSYPEVFAPLVSGQAVLAFAWLRKPGVGIRGREYIIQALTGASIGSPKARAEFIQATEDTLEFYLASSLSDNVIDSMTISNLVYSLTTLRSVGSRNLIQRLWAKDYIMESYAGDLDSILEDLISPETPQPTNKLLDIFSLYETYENHHYYDEEEGDDRASPSLLEPYLNPKRDEPGRNDPCSCGSGKKYKKCCLR
jgi:tetratricopeptide (TPR) repeat protein